MIHDALTTTVGDAVEVATSLTNFTDEIVGVLPVVIPVVITVLALRKGLRFLLGTLRGA